MKPHVRYGHTPHSTAGGGGGRSGGGGLYQPQQQYRRPAGAGGEDGVDGGPVMIEEYKLEEQLAPFYSEAAAPSVSSPRCYLPPGTSTASSSSANNVGVKPALRTVSIMETLSQLTNGARGVDHGSVGRRPDVKNNSGSTAAPSKASAAMPHVVRRKKAPSAVVPHNDTGVMASLLDIPQWYPTKRPSRPEPTSNVHPVTSPKVWDVSRLSSKLGVSATGKSGTIGRSMEHILSGSSIQPVPSSTSAHGYGSLERKRRRRPGARGAGLSARRGETDWEREEDEEDEMLERDVSIEAAAAAVHHYHSVGSSSSMVVPGALFQQQQQRSRKQQPHQQQLMMEPPGGTERDRERARQQQGYKLPTEWLKKKTRPQPQPTSAANNNNNVRKNNNNNKTADVVVVERMKEPPRGQQTPDWIHKIFHVARRGNLLKLQRVVAGMEPTLVRNLSDHRGNNLLHVLAGAGNADALAWLCSSFGPEMQDALLDENKRGLTPVVAAIQAGRLEALQFLVEHTSARDRLAPVDGDRSLLHIAAKYGKIDLVAWLAQYMESHGLEIDLRDHSGHSPLHLAARAGQASAVAILVAHGADVTAKNDMGHRPLDLASASGHVGVAQLLRLHDAALCLSAETLQANEELDDLRGDYAELKSYFRDVLVIGKRFAKERDEMCRQLGRLYEDVTSLHQALLFELRAAHRDLAGVRDQRVNSSNARANKSGEFATSRNLDESVAVVEALHDKWQNQQRGWFSSNLADMEHRLLMAEDGWKRLRTSSGTAKHRTCQIRPHELLRSRLAAVNAQASSIQCDVTALSSSEGSLYSTCCQSASDDDSTDDQLVDHHQPVDAYNEHLGFHQTASSGMPASASAWYGRTPTAAAAPSGRMAMMKRSAGPESADSVYNTLQAAVRKINTPEREVIKEQQVPANVMTPVNKKPVVSSRQELRKRLQEVKLTSESGNASVIEVIEPSSSEDEGGLMMMTRPPQDQSTPLRSTAGNARSFNASFSEELEKARQNKINNRTGLLDSPASAHSKSSDPLTKALLAEPDLLAGTVATTSASRSCHDLALNEPEDDINPSTRSHSSLSSSNNTAVTLIPRKKSGGFLTKFALKARWPSKRKTPTDSITGDTAVASDGAEDLCQQQDGTASDESLTPSGSNASGVVAGLSQMFEDMSALSARSPPSAGMMEKRPNGQTPSSRNSLTMNNVGAGEQQQPITGQGTEEDLPPSTSPPPVPLEIETYNSMSPSSSQETSSSSNVSCSGASQPMPPPPPPRCGSELNKATTPSSSASSSTSASHGGVESLSVAASEDSGIVMARPASSASKSDSSPRAAATAATSAGATNSAYAYATYGPLRCKPATGLDSTERLSPAPSDMSKAESAATCDLSKTESMRHFRQLARIEESAAVSAAAVMTEEVVKVASPDKPSLDVADTHHQSGQILTWREAKLKNQVVTPPPLEERLNKARVRLEEKSIRTLKKRHHVSERPWYDVSDDESDMLTPERITKLKTSLSSSDTTSASSSEEDVEV